MTTTGAVLWVASDLVCAVCFLAFAAGTVRAWRDAPGLLPGHAACAFASIWTLLAVGLTLDAAGVVWPQVWAVRVVWGLALALVASVGVLVIAVTPRAQRPTPAPGPAVLVETEPQGVVVAPLRQRERRPEYPTARQVRRMLADGPVGLCLIDASGVITHIEGGALRTVGTTPRAWVGLPVAEPWRSLGWERAMQGHVASFGAPDPVSGTRGQLITYAPQYDGRGRIVGAVCWWAVAGEGQRIYVDPEGDLDG